MRCHYPWIAQHLRHWPPGTFPAWGTLARCPVALPTEELGILLGSLRSRDAWSLQSRHALGTGNDSDAKMNASRVHLRNGHAAELRSAKVDP